MELAFALRNFFLPHRYRDPFGHITIVEYDPLRLAPAFTRDAAGNETRVEFDYRVVKPRRLTDPNGNRSEARFDALGMLVGTALRGKADGPVEGNSFDHFMTDPSPGEVAAYFAAAAPADLARSLLGTATAGSSTTGTACRSARPRSRARPM